MIPPKPEIKRPDKGGLGQFVIVNDALRAQAK
ncbi:hypothetical protein J2Z66_002134 [Paenibacillus eucommiae]|uniref:Uncharacterized protein n=1 Tax=Paenibacillus eucommiae TaxID=1355755 RepID=A0ABS4ISJ2_9BACL|nr:hypothetical protein [Paenibacillus eucommiae]